MSVSLEDYLKTQKELQNEVPGAPNEVPGAPTERKREEKDRHMLPVRENRRKREGQDRKRQEKERNR